MNLEYSLSHYYELFSNLPIQEIIVYYFLISIFLTIIERVLDIKIDTKNRVDKNHKVLLALILVYFVGIMSNVVSNLLNMHDLFIELILGAFSLTLLLAIFKIVFYGFTYSRKIPNKNFKLSGVIKYFFRIYLKKRASRYAQKTTVVNKGKRHEFRMDYVLADTESIFYEHKPNYDVLFIHLFVCLIVLYRFMFSGLLVVECNNLCPNLLHESLSAF